MKRFMIVILLAAVLFAAWFYNSGVTAIAVLPVILLVQSILVAGNLNKAWGRTTPDMARTKAGVSTKISVWSYITATAILPYLWVAIFSMLGFFPLATIIVFLTLPVAIGCSRSVFYLPDGATGLLADISDRTVNLTLIFSTLLALAFVIGKFI